MREPPSGPQRARLFQSLRTAHLEQASRLPFATIYYRTERYDFDVRAGSGLRLVKAGPLRTAWLLFRSRVTQMEINEPLMRYGIRGSALAVLALRLRAALGGARAEIVTFAIENLDPFGVKATSPRSRAATVVDRFLTRFVWRRIDRIVYGTSASRALYRAVLGQPGSRTSETLISALPEACSCADGERDPHRVIFLGAFSERKGFPLLAAAWPLVVERLGDARLTLVGKGPLERTAHELAENYASVELFVDPDRSEIHRQLRRAQVATLPSQPMHTWKEQVGRPIIEALSHGCTIVSTDETGLADWLEKHGHRVIPSGGSAESLANALVDSIREHRPAYSVLRDLPARDGRLEADDWMFGSEAASGGVPAWLPDR